MTGHVRWDDYKAKRLRRKMMGELPMVDKTAVKLLRHHEFYEYPLTGELEWNGKKYWFQQHFVPGEEYREGLMEIVDLTPEQWQPIDELTELFNKYVGTHCEYDPETQRRDVYAQQPHSVEGGAEGWHTYYDDPRVKTEVWRPEGTVVALVALFVEEGD